MKPVLYGYMIRPAGFHKADTPLARALLEDYCLREDFELAHIFAEVPGESNALAEVLRIVVQTEAAGVLIPGLSTLAADETEQRYAHAYIQRKTARPVYIAVAAQVRIVTTELI